MNRAIRRLASGGLSVLAAVLASPGIALGATPEGTTGGSGIVSGPDAMSAVLEIVVKVGVIAVVLAVLVALGYGVALIGGRRLATDPPASRIGRTAMVIVAAVASGALVVGIVVGREIAHAQSVGGFGGIIGAAILTASVIGAVIALVMVGLVATKFRHGHVSSAIASILAAATLLIVGTIGGGAAASAFGGLYHEPVILEARGTTTVAMRSGGPFVARDGGLAACHSTPDGRAVGRLTALDLGELGSGTLRADLDLWGPRPDQAGGSFFIDGADITAGASQPTWTATAVIMTMAVDGASGTLTFEGRADAVDLKDPGGPVGVPPGSAWPATIAGTISWACGSW